MPHGTSLFDAQNPLHLLVAIHDALMGIMASTEAGKVHPEINAYNLILINPGPNTPDKESNPMNLPKVEENPNNWDREVSPDNTCPRRKRVVGDLERRPLCVVHDTEFMMSEDRNRNELHSDRTCIPAFLSIQLIESYMFNSMAGRSFIHNAESLLWVLIWVVAHRSLGTNSLEISSSAEEIILELSTPNMPTLCTNKRVMIADGPRLVERIQEMGTDLAVGLADVIGSLADFFFIYLYSSPPKSYTRPLSADSDSKYNLQSVSSADTALDIKKQMSKQLISALSHVRQERYNLHAQYIAESRAQTFERLFDIINEQAAQLTQWYSLPEF